MSKPHRCLPRGWRKRRQLDPDAVVHCICGNHWMLNGQWTRAEYELRYLNGPKVWSIWLYRYHSTEVARMSATANREEAQEWARACLLKDDVEILKFTAYGTSDEATTYRIWYAPVANGLRASARSEMP